MSEHDTTERPSLRARIIEQLEIGCRSLDCITQGVIESGWHWKASEPTARRLAVNTELNRMLRAGIVRRISVRIQNPHYELVDATPRATVVRVTPDSSLDDLVEAIPADYGVRAQLEECAGER